MPPASAPFGRPRRQANRAFLLVFADACTASSPRVSGSTGLFLAFCERQDKWRCRQEHPHTSPQREPARSPDLRPRLHAARVEKECHDPHRYTRCGQKTSAASSPERPKKAHRCQTRQPPSTGIFARQADRATGATKVLDPTHDAAALYRIMRRATARRSVLPGRRRNRPFGHRRPNSAKVRRSGS